MRRYRSRSANFSGGRAMRKSASRSASLMWTPAILAESTIGVQPGRVQSRERTEEVGRVAQSSSLLRSGLLPRAHAGNPSSAPDEVPVIVRETKRLDVAQARTVPADTLARDTAIYVV
jgi:hypothetical protein